MTIINYKNKKSIIIILLYFIYFYIEKKYHYKLVAISYANNKFIKQLKINQLTAINVGKVDEYYSYKFDDIDLNFLKSHKDILSRPRGNGYWLWKPYFILKTFKEKLNKGDYLIYTDAGIFYLDKVEKIIKYMISINEDIWLNRLTYKEKKYSKRDAFILLDADSLIYTDTFQYMAGIQIFYILSVIPFYNRIVDEIIFASSSKESCFSFLSSRNMIYSFLIYVIYWNFHF